MKRFMIAMGLLAVLVGSAPQAQAQSNDECAIWLCAPFGFLLPNCGNAFKAMMKRVVRFKPPVPSWRSCEEGNSGVDMSIKDGIAAVMVMEQRSCILPGPMSRDDDCVEWRVNVPGEYVRDVRCYDLGSSQKPNGCLATYKYIDVFRDGKPYGDTYYWPE